MRKHLDLNCAPIDLYPVIKVLTISDMTTSQLDLPRHSVEEFIILNMPEALKAMLNNGEKRADIWVVDDENHLEHYLTMVNHDHHYSIMNWNVVLQSRELRAGQEVRFGWIDEKLHFIVTPEDTFGEETYFADDEESDEDFSKKAENDEQNGKQGKEEPMHKSTGEPEPKRRKTDIGIDGSSLENTIPSNP